MFSFKKMDRHAALMTRMADAVGQDLSAQILRGDLAPQDYRTLLLACVGCKNADRCTDWLDAQTDLADAPPAFCRNKPAFERGAT
ncbi:MAG: DUF6455 family protein [Pseudomonadota bacterium]